MEISLRTYVPFGSGWRMRIDHPYSLWVRDRELCWSCGQCPLDSDGQVIAPGDFMAQTRNVALSIEQSLRSLQLGIVHVAKLVIYHVPDASSGQALAESVERFSARFLIVPITVPHFYYEGMLIEIDVFCSHSQPAKTVLGTEPGPQLTIIDGPELVYAAIIWNRAQLNQPGAWESARALLQRVMLVYDLSNDQLLSDRWFVIGPEATAVLNAANRDGFCSNPVSAVLCKWNGDTGAISDLTFVARRQGSCAAELSHGNVWLRRRGRFFNITVRDRIAGTSLSMRTTWCMEDIRQVLKQIGSGFTDICKATTLYVGGSRAAVLHENMAIRNSFYQRPGPASTGVPVAGFPFSGHLVSIDLLGTLYSSAPGADSR